LRAMSGLLALRRPIRIGWQAGQSLTEIKIVRDRQTLSETYSLEWPRKRCMAAFARGIPSDQQNCNAYLGCNMSDNGKKKPGKPMISATASPPDGSAHQRESRRLQGKALRQKCPRSSHGRVILGQTQRDPLALLEESDQGRVEELL